MDLPSSQSSNAEEISPNMQSGEHETRSPPSLNSMNLHQAHFNESENRSPDTSLFNPDIKTLQAHIQYTNTIFQRQILELKNALSTVNQKNDTNYRESQAIKAATVKLEAKQGPLQKMLASHADKLLTQSREKTELENAMKGSIQETNAGVEEIRRDVEDLKRRVAELERTAQSGTSSSGVPASSENLGQLVEDVERQLALYDVRIAEMDLRFQVLECTSYNGTMIWKIKDYTRRKREAVSGRSLSLYSQPFYTSRYGYKMCARIYLNGDGMGKGTHISLFFVVMKGEYDALMPWPFRQKVTLMLLDQGPEHRHLSDTFRPDPSSSSFKKPTSDMNIASGCPLFVAHNVADGSTYVKEDMVYIKIQVEISDLENV